MNYPKPYAPSTLKRLYAKLGLSEERIELLHRYLDAMANLYRIIPLRKAFEIFNRQNKPGISEKDFSAFSEIARREEHFYLIMGEDELYSDVEKGEPMDRLLIHESLILFGYDDFYEMAQAQGNKPYYIPPKKELLKYENERYYEKTVQTDAMQRFLEKDMKLSKEKVDELMFELHLTLCGLNFSLNQAVDVMDRHEVRFDTKSRAEKFATLYVEWSNHTRIPANRGYSPNGLFMRQKPTERIPKEISFGPGLIGALQNGDMDPEEFKQAIREMDLPSEALRQNMLENIENAQQQKPAKVGRNDPCPCGSGKKYKKCCGA